MSIEAKVCVTLERAADGELFLRREIDGDALMPELKHAVSHRGPSVPEAAARALLIAVADMVLAFNPEG